MIKLSDYPTTWLDVGDPPSAAKPTSRNSHFEVLSNGWIAPGARVVDAACGGGQFARELYRRGFTVRAFDIDPRMVARTQSLLCAMGMPADVADDVVRLGAIGEDLPASWCPVQYLTCFEAVEHLGSPAGGLMWMHGQLERGGWCIGSVPDMGKDMHAREDLADRYAETAYDMERLNRHRSAFSQDGLAGLLRATFYTNVEVIKAECRGKARLLWRAQK